MNAIGNKCFLCLLEIWRDEECRSPVEGAILASGMASALMLATVGLRGELHQIFDFVSSLAASF